MPKGERYKFFGTDGIRGVAGQFPLDEATVELIGRTITSNLRSEIGHAPHIVIGRDTRESGPSIERALARGALSEGGRVESAGVITTPGVAYIARTTPFDAGIVISASHNPYRDNGIKVFSASGKKLADETEQKIEEDLSRLLDERDAELASGGDIQEYSGDESQSRYRAQYIAYLANDVGGGLSLEGVRLAIDCANGAAGGIAPEVFKRLGADTVVISASPDGRNINEACGSLHTERLAEVVRDERLDLGIAFDGDADRALFIDSNGNLIDGDHTILILADDMKARGMLAGDLVVATVMSNVGLEIALSERGIRMLRAPVGDRFVLEQLLAHGGKLGGEQSGHIIFPDISLAGDGIITAIEVLRAVRRSGRSLGALASRLRKFPQVLINVRVKSKPALDSLPEVKSEMEKLEQEMQGRGRLLVRYSGTENIARVMIEGESQSKIEEQASRLAAIIEKAIG